MHFSCVLNTQHILFDLIIRIILGTEYKLFSSSLNNFRGTRYRSINKAPTSRKVAGSRPDEVNGFFEFI
jgi:hypothetical protein